MKKLRLKKPKNAQMVLAALSSITAISGMMHRLPSAPLTAEQIARAWESPAYRNTLTAEQRKQLPANPAGELRFTVADAEPENLFSHDACSGNNCSTNNCSTDNCSGNNCSTNNCSTDNCSGNNCSTDNCSGYNCSGNACTNIQCQLMEQEA